MNENSPICARLIPACTDVRGLNPVRNELIVTNRTLPAITATENASTAPQCCTMMAGSMSMPTEMKKIAANMSRTGMIRCSTTFSSPDSAISEPAMNAPSATE